MQFPDMHQSLRKQTKFQKNLTRRKVKSESHILALLIAPFTF